MDVSCTNESAMVDVNINPFNVNSMLLLLLLGAFTRLVRKSFYFNYVAMSVMMLCGKGEVVETDNKVTWKFKDETDHGFSKEEEDMYDRHWRLNWMFLVQNVSCTNESAMVDVEYKSIPM